MGNIFCVTRKAASKKHINRKILEFVVPVLVNEMLEKVELKQHLLADNHDLESRCMYHPSEPAPVSALKISPEAESVVASKRALCRIKLVITKQQLRELVSKRISVQDIIEVRKAEKCGSNGDLMNAYWRPELESIPEENEI